MSDVESDTVSDALLREALREGPNVFFRGCIARELVRIHLTANKSFVIEEALSCSDTNAHPGLVASVIRELGVPPRTDEKQDALRRIMFDERFTKFCMLKRHMGSDATLRDAGRTLELWKGAPVITQDDFSALRNPAIAEEHLVDVMRRIDETLR